MRPLVSFVVPCYKLAHLLGECVGSILRQTYTNFEVLVMDDCSPDETPAVAQSFGDSRVRHIRNEPNLGHLKNYNKGIGLARGEYVWLISADDRLRTDDALARYVAIMEQHPKAAFACCPALELRDGEEGERAEYSFLSERDRVFSGDEFARRLAEGNCVIAASGMVRRTIYETCGAFPLDLPYAGDWYLWALFSLYGDVAYLAEPLVNYRIHGGSMTSALMEDKVRLCQADDVAVLWRIAERARERGKEEVARLYLDMVAREYARQHVAGKYREDVRLPFHELESSLARHAARPADARWVEARACAYAGDRLFHLGRRSEAAEMYRRSLLIERQPAIQLKAFLLRGGNTGKALRQAIFALRH